MEKIEIIKKSIVARPRCIKKAEKHMKAIEFVTAIRKRVIENDYSIYQDLFEDTIKSDDPVWKEILSLYNI